MRCKMNQILSILGPHSPSQTQSSAEPCEDNNGTGQQQQVSLFHTLRDLLHGLPNPPEDGNGVGCPHRRGGLSASKDNRSKRMGDTRRTVSSSNATIVINSFADAIGDIRSVYSQYPKPLLDACVRGAALHGNRDGNKGPCARDPDCVAGLFAALVRNMRNQSLFGTPNPLHQDKDALRNQHIQSSTLVDRFEKIAVSLAAEPKLEACGGPSECPPELQVAACRLDTLMRVLHPWGQGAARQALRLLQRCGRPRSHVWRQHKTNHATPCEGIHHQSNLSKPNPNEIQALRRKFLYYLLGRPPCGPTAHPAASAFDTSVACLAQSQQNRASRLQREKQSAKAKQFPCQIKSIEQRVQALLSDSRPDKGMRALSAAAPTLTGVMDSSTSEQLKTACGHCLNSTHSPHGQGNTSFCNRTGCVACSLSRVTESLRRVLSIFNVSVPRAPRPHRFSRGSTRQNGTMICFWMLYAIIPSLAAMCTCRVWASRPLILYCPRQNNGTRTQGHGMAMLLHHVHPRHRVHHATSSMVVHFIEAIMPSVPSDWDSHVWLTVSARLILPLTTPVKVRHWQPIARPMDPVCQGHRHLLSKMRCYDVSSQTDENGTILCSMRSRNDLMLPHVAETTPLLQHL